MTGNGNGTVHSGAGNGYLQAPGWTDKDDPFPQTPWGDNPWEHAEETLDFLDPATAEIPSYDRPWLIKDWLPLNETVGLGGPGGRGKTLLAHMLACAASSGASWLGLPTTPMKSALILCEDRQDDVMWRQRDINRRHPAAKGRVRIYPRRDKDNNYLGIFDRDGDLHETVFFAQLLQHLREFAGDDPLLTILDTRADVFRGNQNDEQHARMFVRKICDKIARLTHGIVILVYQPSVAGMQSGSGTSGSVQWDAAFRARLYLTTEKDEEDPKKRVLQLIKANHAESDQTLDIRWDNGFFVRQEEFDADKPVYELQAERSKFQNLFKAQFAKWTHSHPLTNNDASRDYYAPKRLAKDYLTTPGAAKVMNLERGLAQAMAQLIQTGEFWVEETKLYGHPFSALRRLAARDTPADET